MPGLELKFLNIAIVESRSVITGKRHVALKESNRAVVLSDCLLLLIPFHENKNHSTSHAGTNGEGHVENFSSAAARAFGGVTILCT
jgi:hypothetical protein